ncbi:hypothetical protein TIFTF001_025311 [Ficus carica]|uniref:Uncharacterized protein n=1 Tax=Ficus carica TaxID=3494 RepID=A0AA88APR1_FICCA|nr:hypothetical protein TIFTF001_025311 [Ficus carica]
MGNAKHTDSQVNRFTLESITTRHDSYSNFPHTFQSTMTMHAGHSPQHDAISRTYEDPITTRLQSTAQLMTPPVAATSMIQPRSNQSIFQQSTLTHMRLDVDYSNSIAFANGEIFLRGDAITRPNLMSISMFMEEEDRS